MAPVVPNDLTVVWRAAVDGNTDLWADPSFSSISDKKAVTEVAHVLRHEDG
jgi:hypothetical protein